MIKEWTNKFQPWRPISLNASPCIHPIEQHKHDKICGQMTQRKFYVPREWHRSFYSCFFSLYLPPSIALFLAALEHQCKKKSLWPRNLVDDFRKLVHCSCWLYNSVTAYCFINFFFHLKKAKEQKILIIFRLNLL